MIWFRLVFGWYLNVLLTDFSQTIRFNQILNSCFMLSQNTVFFPRNIFYNTLTVIGDLMPTSAVKLLIEKLTQF